MELVNRKIFKEVFFSNIYGLGLDRPLRSYNNFVVHYPLLSMAVTTGTTMGLGSMISQTIIEHRGLMDLDWSHIIRFSAFGYFISVNFLYKKKISIE